LGVLVKCSGDRWARQNVEPNPIDEIESARGTEIVTPTDYIDTQLGELVADLAGVTHRHRVARAVYREDAAFRTRQHHQLPLRREVYRARRRNTPTEMRAAGVAGAARSPMERERKRERRARAHLTLHPDLAAVELHELHPRV